MDMACPEPCFQAENPEECYQLIQEWTSDERKPQKLSLFGLTQKFCHISMTQQDHEALSELDSLNLFVVTSGVYPLEVHMIF